MSSKSTRSKKPKTQDGESVKDWREPIERWRHDKDLQAESTRNHRTHVDEDKSRSKSQTIVEDEHDFEERRLPEPRRSKDNRYSDSASQHRERVPQARSKSVFDRNVVTMRGRRVEKINGELCLVKQKKKTPGHDKR